MIKSVSAIPKSKLSMLEGALSLTINDQNVLRTLLIYSLLSKRRLILSRLPVYIVPCVKGLQYHIRKASTKYHSSFVLALKESLQKRMPSLRQMEHTYWQAFSILVSSFDGVKQITIN